MLHSLRRSGIRLVHAFRELRRSQEGVAAVEFAMIVPVALLLLLGAAVVADATTTSRAISQVTRTLADLTSQMPTSAQTTSTPTPTSPATSQMLSTALTSAAMLLYPKPTSALQMTISAIDVKNNSSGKCCDVKVRWSFTQNGQLRACGAGQSLPASLIPTSGVPLAMPLYYIVADVAYPYAPLLKTTWVNFAQTLQRTEYMMPRTTGQVTTVQPLTGSNGQSGVVCY